MSTVLDERYRLHSLSESYPWGDYWEAEYLLLQKKVMVLKFSQRIHADPRCHRLAMAMAGSWRGLEGRGIIRVMDLDDDGGYLVTEPVSAGSLSRLLDTGGFDRYRLATALARSSAQALGFAGSRRIHHLGVNPRSMFLRPDGGVEIGHFGFWYVLREAPDLIDPYHQRYLAPEQKSGGAVGSFTDVYGLATVLLEAILGGDLWKEVSSTGEARSSAERLQEPWRSVLRRGLSPDPRDRYFTVESVVEDLLGGSCVDEALSGVGGPVGQPGTRGLPGEAETCSWSDSGRPGEEEVPQNSVSRGLPWGEERESFHGDRQGVRMWFLLLFLSFLLAVVIWVMVLR